MGKEDAVLIENHQNGWLTEVQVSSLVNLSLSTLRAHRFQRRGIPYAKVGRSVRYARQDVLAFMQSCRIDPSST